MLRPFSNSPSPYRKERLMDNSTLLTNSSDHNSVQSPSRRNLLGNIGGAGGAIALSLGASSLFAQTNPTQARQDKPLKGKVAIVTGARNNQGRAYAVALGAMGADVVVHYHRAETKDQADETARLVRATGARVSLVHGDLGEVSNVKKVFDTAEKDFGRVDFLVHTAGVIIKKPMVDVTEADYERSHRANTKAALFAMSEAGKRMKDNGRMIIIGTSLTAGSAPQYALYAGTKAPTEEFARMMAKEVGKRGITINVIAPGPLDNTFFHAAETPQSAQFAANLSIAGRLGKVEDVVPLVEFLASPQSQWITGQTLWINGGYLTR
jgi:NAD(P)-dependent dehydrogenase (short-subunit alcohol dehydrogenase family)